MSSYPVTIRRCQHIKVNGTQCGSPALREAKYCFFHMGWSQKNREINMNLNERGTITLPTLEDANSVQIGLSEVMRLIVTNQIDYRAAALLLYALQTASSNLKRISFEPEPTCVVIDCETVERRPIGASAWSAVEGRDYDDIKKDEADKNNGNGETESLLKQIVRALTESESDENTAEIAENELEGNDRVDKTKEHGNW
jgi:hypothetical protein